MSDVFISYSRKDQDFVRQLNAALNEKDRQAWVDWEGIPFTADWWEEIQRGIEAADSFLFVISPDSVASKVCNMEIEHAIQNNKRLIPVVRREAIPEQIHRALARHNWLYCRDGDNFEVAFTQLIDALNTDFEYVRAQTRLLVRAREWEEKDRNRSFLLRGDELGDAESVLAQSGGKEPKPTELQTNYIITSRRHANSRQRSLLASVTAALGVTVVLAAISVGLFGVAESRRQESDLRGTEVAQQAATATNALGLSEVRGTEVAQQAATATNALGLSEVRGTEVAFNVATAIAAEATSARRAVEWQGLAWSVAAERAYANDEGDLALALALFANQIPNPPPEVQAQLRTVAYAPGTAAVYASGHDYWIESLAVNADNTRLLSTGQDGKLNLWDVATGAVLQQQATGTSTDVGGGAAVNLDGPTAVAFHPTDPNVAVVGYADGRVVLLDVATWTIRTQVTSAELINVVAFSPDGNWIALGFLDTLDTLEIRDGKTLALSASPRGHRDTVTSVVFSPDSTRLLTASDDATARLWTVPAGDPIQTYGPIEDPDEPDVNLKRALFGAVRRTTEDTIIIGTNSGQIVTLDQASGDEMLRYDTGFTPTTLADLALSPDGETLISAGYDGLLYLWETREGRLLRLFRGHSQPLSRAVFAPDGTSFYSAAQDLTIRRWYTRSGGETHRFSGFDLYTSATRSQLTPDGQHIVTVGGFRDPAVLVWELQNDQLQQRLEGHTDSLVTLDTQQTADGGLRVVSAGWDGDIRVWDVARNKTTRRIALGAQLIPSVLFTPDGEGVLAAVIGADPEVRSRVAIYDLATGAEVRRYDTGFMLDITFAYSPDHRTLLIGGASETGDGVLALLDVASGETVRTFPQVHDSSLQTVAFSADGTRALSAGQEGLAVEWEVATGRELHRFVGHSGVIGEINYSPDEAWIVTASYDDTIRLWDRLTGREILRLTTDQDARGVFFAPDGTLYTTTQDGALTRWDIPLAPEAVTAWAQAHRYVRDLTCAERATNRIGPLCAPSP